MSELLRPRYPSDCISEFFIFKQGVSVTFAGIRIAADGPYISVLLSTTYLEIPTTLRLGC